MLSSWLRNMSVSRRLIIIVTSINLIALFAISLISVSSNQQTLESQATVRFTEKNQQAAEGLAFELVKVMTTADNIQRTLSNLQSYSQQQLRTLFHDIITQDEDVLIHRISVYRPSNTTDGEASDDSVIVFQIPTPRTGVIAETRTFTFDNQQPAPTLPMFSVIALNTPLWFIQEQAYQDREGLGAVSLALPYTFSEGVQGVIWVDIPQTAFDEMVTSQLVRVGLLAETTNGYAMLIDDNSTILAHNGDSADLITDGIVAQIFGRINPQDTIDNLYLIEDPITTSESLVTIEPIPTLGWRLVSVLPRVDIPSPSGLLAFQLMVITVAGIAITIIAVNYFTQSAIVAPLSNLRQAAQEIGSGDLRYHIAYRDGDDEIAFLARAMEDMKGNIAYSYDELRNWSRTLEQRVYDRTKELNATRKEAEDIADELRAVYDESLMVVNAPTLEPILDAFTHRILMLMNASYCSVWLLDDSRTQIRLVTNSNQEAPKDFTMDATLGLVGQSILQQVALIVNDYDKYDNKIDLPFQDVTPFVRGMSAPLMFDGYPVGAVVVGRPDDSEPFIEADIRRLTLFANLVSPAVRNAQLFNQREQARQEAERANQVKTRFLASVTHELRTPLNLIINNMDFMRIGAFGDVNDDQVSRLNQTVRSAEHLLYLINDLLDVSKIEAGEMQLYIQTSDVHTIIEDSIDTTLALIEKLDNKSEHVELVTDIDEQLPKIPMDARRIRQVLTNLLSNAIKFTHEGQVTLTVEARDEGIYFAVSDTGIAIPDDEREILFEAFERTTQAKEQNIEGTGLGLPISQFLVKQHGGILDVESIIDEGTTFMFTLPYTTPADEDNKDESPMMPILKSDD